MKKLLYCFLLVSLNIVAVMPSIGQITITSSDVNATFAPGRITTAMVDTGTHAANIGALGATSWDFSALTIAYSGSSVTADPDTTPFIGLFPSATHAIKVGTGYSYFALSSSLQALGFAQGPPAPIRSKNIPAEVIMQLPMTIGTTWTATYVDSTYITISGTTYPAGTNNVVNYTVDSYGSLTLPGGSVYQALRLKTDRHVSNPVAYRSITYQFITKEGAGLTAIPSDTNQPQTGTISVISLAWNLAPSLTSVEEIPGGDVPVSFALGQNYPNPFNPFTTIRYQLPKQIHVTLKVLDLLGREVATLVNRVEEPGDKSVVFDASKMSSGIYFYRLQAGSFAEIRKMLLLK